jgi:hypothetical protein
MMIDPNILSLASKIGFYLDIYVPLRNMDILVLITTKKQQLC